jgi:hypothetical protein
VLDLAATATPLEGTLAELEKPLTHLAAAGVLAGLGLTFVEGEERCGVSVLFAADAFGEVEEVDIAALRLLVGPEPEPVVEILVTDEPMSRVLVERVVLPALSPASLACCAVSYQADEPAIEGFVEDSVAEDLLPEEEFADEFDDDDSGGGGSDNPGGSVPGEYPDADGLPD